MTEEEKKHKRDIIERIIYDVTAAKHKYIMLAMDHVVEGQDLHDDICVKECDEELEFLEELKKKYV